MKKAFSILFFISLMCGFAFAQSSFPELEIAKEIKLLKSTRSDVKRIMSEFDSNEKVSASDEDEEDNESGMSEFRSDDAEVRVYYSSGGCSKDEDYGDSPEWNTSGIKATKVVIIFHDTVKLKDLGLNLSDFKKRLQHEDAADDEDSIFSKDYIYQDEKAGILITSNDDEVEQIVFHPPPSHLCKDETNSEIFSGETSFVDAILGSVIFCRLLNYPPKVTNLDLKTNGVFGCKDEKCLDAKKEISVTTTAVDLENDTLVYSYIVTGGKITGSGASVVWDLAGVLPGTYSITAQTDDGCGTCGETKSQKILVKENSVEIVQPAKIKELILDKSELIAACPVGRLRRIRCESGNCGIVVSSVADGKIMTYNYQTNGGEIVGSGDKVLWNLAGLKPGEYSITGSASDDGTIFGEPKTATIEIKENPTCSAANK